MQPMECDVIANQLNKINHNNITIKIMKCELGNKFILKWYFENDTPRLYKQNILS